ncbi:Non-haem bromoperoxidase BPO-A2 [Aedoeadaptatus ivorii]|uniref:Non-haem bromoperoxidase BPO-A2 n=1 Tax=Aedoeadaptatus ivorii TaxID=54006 RepID=A0A3S4ZPV9_9FIRM|nr:alpha/beta hydrolase [Peptoniphilus ivorii]VEJ34747.1 Non-haem bromoperoxidase BPO-A2 [Peptoniphilus ivorii]
MYQYKAAGGEIFAYRRRGTGRAILLLHGNRASSGAMEPLAAPLSAYGAVYVPDMPGFGESTYNHRLRRVEDYGAMMAEFLAAKELEDVVVVGWSFGGAVAMELAKQSERVSALVLLSAVGVGGVTLPGLRGEAQKYAHLPRQEAKRMRIEEMLGTYLFHGELPRAYLHLLEEALKQKNPLDIYRALRRYRCTAPRDLPALIIHGKGDRVIPVSDAMATAAAYPRSELLLLEGGHFLLYNQRDAVLRAIVDFLAAHPKKAP